MKNWKITYKNLSMKHIPTRYFNPSVCLKARAKVIKKYEDEKWNYAKEFLRYNHHITSSAIKISEVVFSVLNIEVFPMVIKVATKGFDISGGTYAFMMYGANGKAYCFDHRAKFYKSMKPRGRVYGTYHDGRDTVVTTGIPNIKEK